jgi:hypothetical protein
MPLFDHASFALSIRFSARGGGFFSSLLITPATFYALTADQVLRVVDLLYSK